MLTTIKQRLGRDEDQGFTLIELMVVLLIIAILLAIAIPTFLGARNTANARAAQSNLNTSLTAEQTQWTNTQAFSSTAATMTALESSITWVATGPVTNSPPNSVLAAVSDNGNIVVLTALGKDNNCWSIAQVNDPAPTAPLVDGTSYTETAQATGGGCASPTAPAAAVTTGSASSGTAGTWYTSF